jgi:hypothetical protein
VRRRRIERFVRERLGCACPSEVFADVRVTERPADFADLPVHRVLGIGGRLLLVVCTAAAAEALAGDLPRVVAAARGMRDRDGYRRVRILVPAADPAAARPLLEPPFIRASAGDERVHLHVEATEVVGELAPRP